MKKRVFTSPVCLVAQEPGWWVSTLGQTLCAAPGSPCHRAVTARPPLPAPVWRRAQHAHEGPRGAAAERAGRTPRAGSWQASAARKSSFEPGRKGFLYKPQPKLLLPRPNQTQFPRVLAGWGLSLGRCFLPRLHVQTNQEEEFKDLSCLWNTLNTERALGREGCG